MLEALEEGQVTIEGATRPLPIPFFVIATQNPVSQGGTFSLPESQLDRFLMRLSLGYPSAEAERQLLLGSSRRQLLTQLQPVLERDDLLRAQQQVSAVRASETLVNYILRLVEATRTHAQLEFGLSPRGSLALLAAARAWAFLAGRDYVIPEDVQAVFPAVAGHRLREHSSVQGSASAALIQAVLADVAAL